MTTDVLLEGTAGAQVRAGDLAGRSLLIVESDCPTCLLALRELARSGARPTIIFEDPPAVAARVARRAGVTGEVLSEPAPYALSKSLAVETVPTVIRLDSSGHVVERVTGFDRAALERVFDVRLSPAVPAQKPGCAARWTYDASVGELDEQEEMFELGWTDGLPVVPPTPERVAAMLAGRDPASSLGPVPPGLGEATLERVAVCAVLAGCRPDYFPVVLAACEAALAEEFNLNALAVTTSPPGQIIVVNGPVRATIGLNSGIGALGPGWRANMTIGRALRLLVTLTGRGRPGTLDRATLGHSGKVGLCLAEDEDASPWEPLHVELGCAAESSAVTLFAGDAPLSISDHRSRTPEQLAATLAWAGAATWSPNWWPLREGTSLFVICPEHASLFAHAGWSKLDLRRAIFETPRRRAADLVSFGEAPVQAHEAAPDEEFQKWERLDDIRLIVAGGEAGRFSAVFGPSQGMTPNPVLREV